MKVIVFSVLVAIWCAAFVESTMVPTNPIVNPAGGYQTGTLEDVAKVNGNVQAATSLPTPSDITQKINGALGNLGGSYMDPAEELKFLGYDPDSLLDDPSFAKYMDSGMNPGSKSENLSDKNELQSFRLGLGGLGGLGGFGGLRHHGLLDYLRLRRLQRMQRHRLGMGFGLF